MSTTLRTNHTHKQNNKRASFDEASTIDSGCSYGLQNYRTKFKMEICKAWTYYGNCPFADQCAFAHGEHELRDRALISTSKYKTRVCLKFNEKGCCFYGTRCQFSHEIPKKARPIIHFQRRISYNSELEKLSQGVISLEELQLTIESCRPKILKDLGNGRSVYELEDCQETNEED